MDDLRTRIDGWLETVPAPGPADLDGAVDRGRRVRRARAARRASVLVVAVVVVAVAGALVLRPGPPDAGPARTRTEVHYPDGAVVAWPAPPGGRWAVEGLTQAATADVTDPGGQRRLREDLLRAVPGSESNDPVDGQYQVGWDGRAGEYTARAVIRRPGPKETRLAFVSVRMTRGGVAAAGEEPFDPCGSWPGPLGLGGEPFVMSDELPFRFDCMVRQDARVGSIVRGDLVEGRNPEQPELDPYRVLSAFTVRPDGTAVRAQVTARTGDLDAIPALPSWPALLDELAAGLPYPGS